MTATPFFVQTPKNAVLTLNNASGTTVTSFYVAGANGSQILSLIASSTDTADQTIQIFATVSATNYLIGSVKIPLGSGNSSSVSSVDLLNNSQIPFPVDAFGNKFIYIASGTTLELGMLATITSGKQIQLIAQIADF